MDRGKRKAGGGGGGGNVKDSKDRARQALAVNGLRDY